MGGTLVEIQQRFLRDYVMQSALIIVVFWVAATLMVYIYVGYPILAQLLAKVVNRSVKRSAIQPRITIVVTAYNEEKSIQAKLDNLMALEYRTDLLDVIVASDASSDATDAIVRTHSEGRVQLLRVEGRQGKTACQNAAVSMAQGEVVIFTDATTTIDSRALIYMVENFSDPEIGCVAGLLRYVDSNRSLTGSGGTSYWAYELSLRDAETRLGSLVGVSGCFYGVRKSAFRDISPALISDFVIALKMREVGLRTILEPRATCHEETLSESGQEMGMRVRVALRSITALVAERKMLNPWRFGVFAWQLWSHKVLRYASPVIWCALLVTSALLSHYWPYAIAFWAQIIVLATGLFGWLLHGRASGPLARPYYFLLTNAASLVALYRFLRGDRVTTWRTVR